MCHGRLLTGSLTVNWHEKQEDETEPYATHRNALIANDKLTVPEYGLMINRGRMEKLRAAWEAKRDGGCRSNLTDNLDGTGDEGRIRMTAARMM